MGMTGNLRGYPETIYFFCMKSLLKIGTPKTKALAIYLFKIFALAVIYHLAARVGLQMAYVQINTSPVWPPTGIALAALLIFGYNIWPGISLGVLAGLLFTGTNADVAIGMTLGNTLEALAGAYLIKRFFDFHNVMNRIHDVVGLGVVAMFCTMISATIGTTILILAHLSEWTGFAAIWSTWWIGDLLGALVVTPVLLAWVTPLSIRTHKRQYSEGALLLLLLILLTTYVFWGKPPDGIFHQALIYTVFPFIIWAALRLGQQGATLTTLAISGIAIWGTVHGLGPFSLESKNDSLVLLQTFMAVVSLTALILAAATVERSEATQAMQQRAEQLATLNDSSRTFLDNFDIASIYQMICRLAVTRLGLDAAWIEAPSSGNAGTGLAAVYGLPAEAVSAQKMKWEGLQNQSQNGYVIETIDDTQPSPDANGYAAYAAFPLIFSTKPIGALKVVSKCKDFFAEDKQLLIRSYANLAAAAVQNTWLLDELRVINRQLHGLSQRLMTAQEDERLHLSRELHDESGQLLAALTVQFGLLERDVEHPEAIRQRIAELNRTTSKIRENLHRLAVNLRPASLDHLGLVTTLNQFIREFSRQYNIDVEFEAVGMQDKRLPIETETTLFRVVQESLTNVMLHAQATRVDVLLSLADKRVSVIIEDNGIGFLPDSVMMEDRLGLFGMRERIEMLGGTLVIESSPRQGTTIKAEVPRND
jgi:signal transduction histidine kinase